MRQITQNMTDTRTAWQYRTTASSRSPVAPLLSAGKPFTPPSVSKESFAKGLIPKFSENPFGWFFGVLIVIELWVLWQLVKAPF